jgi:hypothetical protein
VGRCQRCLFTSSWQKARRRDLVAKILTGCAVDQVGFLRRFAGPCRLSATWSLDPLFAAQIVFITILRNANRDVCLR